MKLIGYFYSARIL